MQPLTETWPGVGDDLKPLKLAIVGCGDIAGYVASIKRLVTQVTLSACCGVHPARAQAFARQHHIPQSFTDYHTLLDMALNSFRGVFGSTHGRAYENTKKWASQEGTTATMKLLFGMGVHSAFDNMSAPAFVLSRYRLPPVLEALAKDVTCTYEKRGWIFARKGEGYLALYSQHPYRWGTSQPETSTHPAEEPYASETEILVEGARNIWLCQMGRKADDGEFSEFVEKVSRAEITFRGMNVQYQSPNLGCIRFGWEGGFSVDGVEIQLRDYPRYDNPYVKAPFNPNEIKVSGGGGELELIWP